MNKEVTELVGLFSGPEKKYSISKFKGIVEDQIKLLLFDIMHTQGDRSLLKENMVMTRGRKLIQKLHCQAS